ncbi:hypothetical protein [Nocardia mexicana]|uniref:hypothetical protein n=1 Tax=Nocardia mexicana TaxID=279262 RepID=UPI0012F48C26|nr:hypothetical protein [Nocardia mexicana]
MGTGTIGEIHRGRRARTGPVDGKRVERERARGGPGVGDDIDAQRAGHGFGPAHDHGELPVAEGLCDREIRTRRTAVGACRRTAEQLRAQQANADRHRRTANAPHVREV